MRKNTVRFSALGAILFTLCRTNAQPTFGMATLNVTIENCSAASEAADRTFAVFPNPAQTTIWAQNPGQAGDFQLFNSIGILVLERTLPQGLSEGFSVAQLPEGAYFARLNTGKKTLLCRVWIQR